MIYYTTFKFYINMGMKVFMTLSIYRFKQSLWLAEYINNITPKRARAKTNFEKGLFKSMNNPFFAKIMENVREKTNLDFILTDDRKSTIKRQCKLSLVGLEQNSLYNFEKLEILFINHYIFQSN